MVPQARVALDPRDPRPRLPPGDVGTAAAGGVPCATAADRDLAPLGMGEAGHHGEPGGAGGIHHLMLNHHDQRLLDHLLALENPDI